VKDLGSDKAVWVGDPGGNLRRFTRKEVTAVSREMVDFRLAVCQNLAAVCLRLEKFETCARWADCALCISGRAPKALMRKGAALLSLNLPGPASDVLATAEEEVPHDTEVRRLLRRAEKMRSPMWVCATGCCGPWGIVCGGPVADTVASVIAPRRGVEPSEPPSESPQESLASLTSASAPSEVSTTVPDAFKAKLSRKPEPASVSEGQPQRATAWIAPEPPVPRRRDVGETEPVGRYGAAALAAVNGSPKTAEARSEASPALDKSAVGLLWIAGGALLVAATAVGWMLMFPQSVST